MSDIVIKAENLGKMYTIGHNAENGRYVALRDVLMQNARTLWNKTKDLATGKPIIQGDTLEEVWALKDVSFEIRRGEAVGIIGRNGAGKSTLLKVLSRITEPSTGRVTIKGRVASLLEVGTGFHPELSGRENIYMNGTILGMTRKEIKRKFDEIIAFAEVEKYLDTPVKRYSSGMYVRLAFAVAAHLEPEILVVDEVLAVGDSAFQDKCLGKMDTIAQGGRTVLFVSHNMKAIRNLCSRCVLLDQGVSICDDSTDIVLAKYNELLRKRKFDVNTGSGDYKTRRGERLIRLTNIEVEDIQGNKRFNFQMGETIRFKLSYSLIKDLDGVKVAIAFYSGMTKDFITSIEHVLTKEKVLSGTQGVVVIELKDICFLPGEYPLYFYASSYLNCRASSDIVDDATAPLVISAGDKDLYSNIDLRNAVGYFAIPSEVIKSEMDQTDIKGTAHA